MVPLIVYLIYARHFSEFFIGVKPYNVQSIMIYIKEKKVYV